MDITLKLKLKELQSLSVEELGKLFDNANDDVKTEILRFVNNFATEFITDTKSTIREINFEVQQNKLHEAV